MSEVIMGIRAIARFLQVGDRRVLDMKKRGAPISQDENGVLRAEKIELWRWFKVNNAPEAAGAKPPATPPRRQKK